MIKGESYRIRLKAFMRLEISLAIEKPSFVYDTNASAS
jgi:hypothetical protein